MDDCQTRVVIGGIPLDVTEDDLQSYFADKRRSGVGPAKRIKFDRSTSTAIVTFNALEGQLSSFI